VFVAVVVCFPVELAGDEEDGVDDEATVGLAARINVRTTAATAPNLRTIGIMAPTVIAEVAGSDVPARRHHEGRDPRQPQVHTVEVGSKGTRRRKPRNRPYLGSWV
jgi:hypothetical protein